MILRDHKESGYGMEPEKLPTSQKEAISLGFQYYLSGSACKHGHTPTIRYTKSGTCVTCVRSRNARKTGTSLKEVNSRGLANMERAIASKDFKPQYVPTKPCKHGHYLRWTASNNCVKCDNELKERRKLKIKLKRIEKEYGLSAHQYYALVNSRNSSCEICGTCYEDSFSLHIDHCHNTGMVRGLLCSKCNQGIGLLGDSVDSLKKAIEYLSK